MYRKWLKEFAEEQHRLKFKNSSVINNVINEQRFPYHAKNAEDRKKIIIIRKFDNCMVHSLDLSVRAILELSRKEFFKELSFENIWRWGFLRSADRTAQAV